MLRERSRLDNKICKLKNQLKDYPKGNFYCVNNKGNYKWFFSDGHIKEYIPKKDVHFAEQLATKKYISLILDDAIRERDAINSYLEKYSEENKKLQFIENNSEYQKLIKNSFKPKNQELSDWMEELYESNKSYPEQLIHKSTSGNFVRSKSELIIDMFLHMNKIPFRYECALQLGETKLYPDFTIKHPESGKLFYWEHFGLMDNSHYAKNAISKLQLYTSFGIIPSINLITTYETSNYPLRTDSVEKIVEQYFLN